MNYDFVQVAESIQHVSKLCSDEDTSPSAAKWIQCQEYFASSLGLSDAEVIDFLVRCAKGGTGVKTKGTFTPNPAPYNVPIDVKDCGNVLGLKHEQLSRARTNIFTKVYSTLMTAPMIFTALSDPLRGPSILS